MRSLIKILSAGIILVSCFAGPLHAAEETQTPPAVSAGSPFELFFTGQDDGAHYIHVLNIGDEALLARVHLIRSAKKSIYIQTYIWTNDESGRYLVYELVKAARRGVKVKIIGDNWKSAKVAQLVSFMATAHPNLEVKTYNPPANLVDPSALRFVQEALTKFKQVNQRMHNKIFIADGRVAITGGRNYENDYFDRGVTRNFKDRDVLVAGPVVREMADSFQEYWDYALVVDVRDLVDVRKLIKSGKFERFTTMESYRLGNLFDETDRLADDYQTIQKTFINNIFKVDKVMFIADKPGKNENGWLKGGGQATAALAKIVFEAEKSIVAQTPYLVLDEVTVRGVRALRAKNPGLDIMISSNSLAATDNIYAYSFSFKQKKLFVQDLRFRIFEMKPAPADVALMMPRYSLREGNIGRTDEESVDSLSQEKDSNSIESTNRHLCIHAKSFVIDDRIAWIGSFNLDPRSVHLNTEVGLVIWDANVARAIKDDILRDAAPRNSWTIGKMKDVPVISAFSGLIGNTLQYVPIVDVWPFQYTSSFALNEGKEPVPFYDDRFYEHYTSVGSFPEVSLSIREIEIRLLKAFTGVAMPII